MAVWDVASGKQERSLKGHDHAIASVLFLSDGRPVSAGNDLVIRIWAAGSDACEAQLTGHSEGVCALARLEQVPSGFVPGEDDPAQRAKPPAMQKLVKVLTAVTAFKSKVKAAALTESPHKAAGGAAAGAGGGGGAHQSEWQPPPVSGAMIMSGSEDATARARHWFPPLPMPSRRLLD